MEKKIAVRWTAARRSRVVFFALNLLAVLPLFLPLLTDRGAAVFLLAMLLSLWLTVLRPAGNTPACAGLPVLLAADLWAYLAAQYERILASLSLPDLTATSLGYFPLAAAGLMLSSSVLSSYLWAKWVARTAAGASVLLCCWNETRGLPLLLALYAALSLLWQTARDLGECADPDTHDRNDVLALLLFLTFALLNSFGTDYLASSFPEWTRLAEQSAAALTPWLPVPAAVLFFCGLTAADYDRASVSLDVYILFSALSFLLLAQSYLRHPFAHGWILLAAFVPFFVWSAHAAAAGERFLRLRPEAWLLVQHAVLFAALFLIRRGLYGNLIAGVASYAALYGIPVGNRREGNLFWSVVLLAIAAQTAAYLCARRLCMENLLSLCAVTAASLLTMAALGARRGRSVPLRFRAAVCVLAAAGCLSLLPRYGVRVEAAFDGGTVHVALSAREDGASVTAASCRWIEWGGGTSPEPLDGLSVREPSVGESSGGGQSGGGMSGGEAAEPSIERDLPVRGELLVITAEDSLGVRTTASFWKPWDPWEDSGE